MQDSIHTEGITFNIHTRIYSATILTVILSACLALPQTVPRSSLSASADAWHSDSLVYVAGLDDVKQNASGSLRITSDNFVFKTRDAHEQIPLRQFTSISIGDERVATGGISAKIARKIPVFGFGAAAGAVTSKTVDVPTIEYQDLHSGYHGAVFDVPEESGASRATAAYGLRSFASSGHWR